MDKLPVELLSMIVEHLREWNNIDQPFSYLTETSLCRTQYDGWLVHTAASRENICNFRLMGRRYSRSSLCAFGGLLGNRIFRLTKVGLDDLQAISRVDALRPFMNTLTFGSAQFAEPGEIGELWILLPERDRTRIRAAYSLAYDWQVCNGPSRLHQRFEVVLSSFPRLHSLRLHPFDNANNNNPLGGWLTGGDYQLIGEAWQDLVTRRNLTKCHPYKPDLSVFAPILRAITSTAKDIRDFRLAPPGSVDASYLYTALGNTNLVSHLRFVRFDLEWRWIPRHLGPPWDKLPKAFGDFANVTHLIINIWKSSLTRDDLGQKSLLQMLSSVTQLKQFVIGGHCHFHEDELVGFVARHNETLEILALKRPIMSGNHGSWTSTAQRIMQMQFPVLRYLELFEMRLCNSFRDFPPAFSDAMEWSEFLFAIENIGYSNTRFQLLSELDITTVRFVSTDLCPPPTMKIATLRPPTLPDSVLLRQERDRARLERLQLRRD